MSHASQTLLFRPFATEDTDLLSAWLTAVGLGVPPGVASETWANRMIEDPHISCWAAHDRGVTVRVLPAGHRPGSAGGDDADRRARPASDRGRGGGCWTRP